MQAGNKYVHYWSLTALNISPLIAWVLLCAIGTLQAIGSTGYIFQAVIHLGRSRKVHFSFLYLSEVKLSPATMNMYFEVQSEKDTTTPKYFEVSQ